MNDSIKRQDAINTVNMMHDACDTESLDDYRDLLVECFEVLPSAQPEQRWIPVTERLPDDGLYLVTTSKGYTQVHVFSHNGNSEEYWMRCNKAWMPLPEPYRGE